MDKVDMLAIRACKATRGEKMFNRLRKLHTMTYLSVDPSDSDLLVWLFDLACEIYPNDMRWALNLGNPDNSWTCGAPSNCDGKRICGIRSVEPSFDKNALWQVTSKLRLTSRDELPNDFISPLKFKD